MKNFLVLSVLGAARADLMLNVFRSFKECGCNVEEGRMSHLGNEFALIVMLSGTWDAIAKMEDLIPRIEKKFDITISARRTTTKSAQREAMPYAVEVVSVNRAGVVMDIAEFFHARAIGIEDMYAGSYAANHTGTEMFSLHITISIPVDLSIASLRGEFMEFCDHLNIDSIMEPVK